MQVSLQGNADFQNMYNYIMGSNATDPNFYSTIETMLDIENFVDYFATEIHIQNEDFINDWWANNTKCWKEQGPNGRWRYMLYDTDAGANYWGGISPSTNFIEMVRNPLFTQSQHSDIFDKMLYNTTFKTYFINRYADF